MMMKAIVSSPKESMYTAVFYYTQDSPLQYDMPIITLPCLNYDHACEVVRAWNNGGKDANS